jgi:sulfite reductase (NADPH) flavoprotein alpha-component
MHKVFVLWGSQSGNARNLGHVIGESLTSEFDVDIMDMGEVAPEEIVSITNLIIVTSTYGDGEPPDNASEWMSYLKFTEGLNLSHLQYAILGLGDTYYPHFCQAGKDFDEYLSKRGAHAMLPRLDCDLYYEEQYPDWVTELKKVLQTDGCNK